MNENIGYLLNQLDDSQKRKIRHLEKVSKKLIDAEYATVFNQCCIKEKLFPKYSDIKTHDPAARNEEFTKDYRMKLVKFQLDTALKRQKELKQEVDSTKNKIATLNIEQNLKSKINLKLKEILEEYSNITRTRITKKLNKLYNGSILLPDGKQNYINLSTYEPSEAEKRLLNLGINCHVKRKFSALEKATELELLYCSILKLEKDGLVEVNKNIRNLLRAESTKCRDHTHSNILNKELQEAAKSLRQNSDIIIRKADKTNIFVILDKKEYKKKLDEILEDRRKFVKVRKNTTAELKTKVNKLIATANNQANEQLFSPIKGEFEPGYIYGNVKIHKQNNPLRPIISQISTATYKIAKEINKLIATYLPAKYSLSSTDQFIDVLKCTEAKGFVASLDVESLFTNVPVEETIKIICNEVYAHQSIAPPKFERDILEKLLKACTTEALFRHIDESLYCQTDGVAMGSPLGVTFANFYMCHVENKVMNSLYKKPTLYCRYVDDCFIVVDSEEDMEILRQTFEKQSVLKFTTEKNNKKTINFLDVHIDYNAERYDTSVHTKATNNGAYLNANSECSERYIKGTVTALIHRTYKISSTWQNFDTSIKKLKQTLINNNYSNTTFDRLLQNYLNKRLTIQEDEKPITKHTLYYKNQFSMAYKTDERILKEIVNNNVKCVNSQEKLQLRIYYKDMKISQLVMKNKLNAIKSALGQANMVYKFTCKHEDCAPRDVTYVGMTTTTLSRRLTMHLQSGAIKNHFTEIHNKQLTRKDLVDYTVTLVKSRDNNRLQIYEALLIQENNPVINLQVTGSARTLHLHGKQ